MLMLFEEPVHVTQARLLRGVDHLRSLRRKYLLGTEFEQPARGVEPAARNGHQRDVCQAGDTRGPPLDTHVAYWPNVFSSVHIQ